MISKLIRRVHMYLGLFFMPWMVMYAISSIVMNHHWLHGTEWEKQTERDYRQRFDADASAASMAKQILADIGMDGAHRVQRNEQQLTITRHDPIVQKRILYTPATGRLVIEHEVPQVAGMLRRLHTRKGYETDYLADDAWAVFVDLIIVASVFWVLSGMWMWWEMKSTRRWGVLASCTGLALFVFFAMNL